MTRRAKSTPMSHANGRKVKVEQLKAGDRIDFPPYGAATVLHAKPCGSMVEVTARTAGGERIRNLRAGTWAYLAP